MTQRKETEKDYRKGRILNSIRIENQTEEYRKKASLGCTSAWIWTCSTQVKAGFGLFGSCKPSGRQDYYQPSSARDPMSLQSSRKWPSRTLVILLWLSHMHDCQGYIYTLRSSLGYTWHLLFKNKTVTELVQSIYTAGRTVLWGNESESVLWAASDLGWPRLRFSNIVTLHNL